MARVRTYKLPNQEKTHREDRFKKQWTNFLKPVAKALKLKIGHFDSNEGELLQMWRKGNKKEVPTERVTLPHWLTWRIQCRFNAYLRQINTILKANREMRQEIKMWRELFEEMNHPTGLPAQEHQDGERGHETRGL